MCGQECNSTIIFAPGVMYNGLINPDQGVCASVQLTLPKLPSLLTFLGIWGNGGPGCGCPTPVVVKYFILSGTPRTAALVDIIVSISCHDESRPCPHGPSHSSGKGRQLNKIDCCIGDLLNCTSLSAITLSKFSML